MTKFANRVLYGRGFNFAGTSSNTQHSSPPTETLSPPSPPSKPWPAYRSKR